MIENFSKEELNNEQWRDIDGYEGMYQVSDLGRVRSRKSGEWKVKKLNRTTKGYLQIDLHRDGKGKNYMVHRLVAQAFIENDDDTKIYINHRDEDKQNNRIWNLEYCTAQYNNTYNDLHRRRKHPKPYIHHQPIRDKVKELYRPDLTYEQNFELLKENGISCSKSTVWLLRKDLGLTKHNVRNAIKSLYDPNMSIKQNLEIFKENGIECCRDTVKNLRKDLGLTRKHKPYRQRNKTN